MKYIVLLILFISITANIYQYLNSNNQQTKIYEGVNSTLNLSSKIIMLSNSKDIEEQVKIQLLTNIFLLNYKIPKHYSTVYAMSDYDVKLKNEVANQQNKIPHNRFFAFAAIYQLKKFDLFNKVNTSIISSNKNGEFIKTKDLMNDFIEANRIKF